MGEKKKMVVIGIDGATFDVIDPMVERGELPNLATLMKEGCRGELESTFPPITHTAWSTFSTGKNPGKHGVFDFIDPPYRNSEDMPFVFTNFNAVKTITFWQILHNTDLKIGIVNLPMAYPPSPLNGFLIGGIDTPNENVAFTYPEDLISQLRERGIHYRPDYVEFLRFKKGGAKYRELEEIRRDYFEIEEQRRKAIQWLMENKEWDLLVVVLSLPDRVQHHFWQFHDSHDPRETNPFRDVIEESYRKVDQIIGDMLKRIDGRVPIMLMSDHGFGKFKKLFFVNHWLWKNGFLHLRRVHLLNFWRYFRFIKIKKPAAAILNFIGLRFLTTVLPSSITEKRLTFFVPYPRVSPDRVDWRKTQAYGGAYGIYVNLSDRTPNGSVNAGADYDETRNRIIEKLKAAVDPETGQGFIEKIVKKEEAFAGPFLNNAPDILIKTKNFDYLPSTNYYFRKGFRKKRFGNHKMEGILILHGPPFKKDHRLQGLHIQDCMPTIFYLLGVPIPSDFDGRILEEGFLEEYLQAHRPEFRDPMPFDAEAKSKGALSTYTPEQSEMIHERLKSLGYID